MNIVDKRGAWAQKNMTHGRERSIDTIVIHGMDTSNPDVVPAVWNTREASAHYGVKNNIVEMYVAETDTAWHAGNWVMNTRSIGVEHLNTADNWGFSDETINTSVEFVASLMKKYGIPIDRVIRHKDVISTDCPQALGNDPMWSNYKARLQAAVGGASPTPSPSPAPAGSKGVDEAIVDAVIAGKYGNGTAREANLRNAGYDPNAVQKAVNAKLAGHSTTPAPAPAPKPAASTPTLYVGVVSNSVGNVQRGLNAVFPAYSHLTVDNVYGAGTKAAVAEFQRRSGLSADGVVGPDTWAKLAQYNIRP